MENKKEILIVDDEVDFRLSLAELLVEQGYKVSTAKDGMEAIQHLIGASKLPDLITVDMRMPIQDGISFKEELQRLQLHQIPLIVISGFLPDQLDSLNGIKAMLSKPFNKFELLHTIENSLISV
jgi:chemosensory pili system protein ChpA (sensor histidine kinase/response regulator)